MIKEEYISFEIAKLLKDKGFNEKCNSYFISDNEIALIFNRRDFNSGIYLSAPTQAMAMMWLREVHKLYIEITPSSKTNEFIVDSYRIDIVAKTFDTIYVSSGYDTYEQACEAAIKYCLENLI